MIIPTTFTPLTELRVDWKQIVSRVPLKYKGHILNVDIKHIGVLSSGFKYPILAIPHKKYSRLNYNIGLLNSISEAVNNQLVYKFSGVKFIKPLEGHSLELVDKIIDMFDASIIDIEE